MIIDDPADQSIATLEDEANNPARVSVTTRRALLDSSITFKPRQSVNLKDLAVCPSEVAVKSETAETRTVLAARITA